MFEPGTNKGRTNGEKQNLKTKPKTNEQTFEFWEKKRMQLVQTKDARDIKS